MILVELESDHGRPRFTELLQDSFILLFGTKNVKIGSIDSRRHVDSKMAKQIYGRLDGVFHIFKAYLAEGVSSGRKQSRSAALTDGWPFR